MELILSSRELSVVDGLSGIGWVFGSREPRPGKEARYTLLSERFLVVVVVVSLFRGGPIQERPYPY
jgi:hypothetical protein